MSNPNMTKDGIVVKAGQVWRDLDKRMVGRTVTVECVNLGVAFVMGDRRTQISVKRMHRHSTGFELVRGKP